MYFSELLFQFSKIGEMGRIAPWYYSCLLGILPKVYKSVLAILFHETPLGYG
jgi:hypothetical protein